MRKAYDLFGTPSEYWLPWFMDPTSSKYKKTFLYKYSTEGNKIPLNYIEDEKEK